MLALSWLWLKIGIVLLVSLDFSRRLRKNGRIKVKFKKYFSESYFLEMFSLRLKNRHQKKNIRWLSVSVSNLRSSNSNYDLCFKMKIMVSHTPCEKTVLSPEKPAMTLTRCPE